MSRTSITGQHFLLFPILFATVISAALFGVSAYKESHLAKDRRAMFANMGRDVSVTGHEIGSRFDIPECPIEGATSSERHYGYVLSETCFKYLDLHDVGRPLAGTHLVWLEQAHLTQHYAAVGLSDSVCAGVVNGKLEALELLLRNEDDLETDARSAFGSPVAEVEVQPETETFKYYFSKLEWRAQATTIQLVTTFATYKQGGHGSSIIHRVIAYTPVAKGLVGDEWQAMRSRCAIR